MKESSFKLIKQPLIKKMEFIGNNEFDIQKENVDIEIGIKFTNECSTTQNKAQVSLNINLNAQKDIKDIPFLLNAEIIGQFSWNNATSEEIEVFLNSVAPSILLSYMRPIISNLVTYSGFPAYIIPFLDLRAVEKK